MSDDRIKEETKDEADLENREAVDEKTRSTKKKAIYAVAALAIAAGLGIGCYVATTGQQGQTETVQESASSDESRSTAVAVKVTVDAEGWKPSDGAFTLVVKNSDGKEAKKLMVMPGSVEKPQEAIEALPEDQRDDVAAAYKGDDGELSASPVLELEPGDYKAELTSLPVLEDGTIFEVPKAVEFTVEEGKGGEIAFELSAVDPEDEEAVEKAVAAVPEGKREAARSQYDKAQGGGSSTGGSSSGKPSGGSSTGGSSSSGNPSTPEKPAHQHSFDIPIVQKQWSDGEGYQRIERWICNDCGQTFGSSAAVDAHIHDMILSGNAGHPTCTVTDDSYDTWTKEPGYYDVVVGYKCSCGAVK